MEGPILSASLVKLKQERLIVFDIDIPVFQENRAFDREYIRKFPGGEMSARLAERAREHGIRMETVDVFLKRHANSPQALCFSNMVTAYTRQLLDEYHLYPAACICLESPIVAYHFYHDLTEYASWFRHVFLFGGTQARIQKPGTIFHNVYWPNAQREVIGGLPWQGRNYLVMINSNKRAFQRHITWDLSHPLQLLDSMYEYLHTVWVHRADPWFHKELYLDRLEAILYFSAKPVFDLYGHGWELPIHGMSQEYQRAARTCYRGELGSLDKFTTMAKYKFAICFENCSFPGYLTEKIFDCFLAGCIPIYYGAPDIAVLVPTDAFIDFRQFGSFEELDAYLRRISPDEAARFLSKAQDFLASERFDKFYQDYLVYQLLDCFEECFARVGCQA